jgi:ribulose 1,5-bisphosphate carboxylase large subunit-like protein
MKFGSTIIKIALTINSQSTHSTALPCYSWGIDQIDDDESLGTLINLE